MSIEAHLAALLFWARNWLRAGALGGLSEYRSVGPAPVAGLFFGWQSAPRSEADRPEEPSGLGTPIGRPETTCTLLTERGRLLFDPDQPARCSTGAVENGTPVRPVALIFPS
jgi:hypothetical protein